MSVFTARPHRLEQVLAGLLNSGTWVASAVIAVGLGLSFLPGVHGSVGLQIVTAGIALFILLPVLRVALMLAAFLRGRDYRFGGIAALVLLIILAGFVIGTMSA